jgi:hypothetical protein
LDSAKGTGLVEKDVLSTVEITKATYVSILSDRIGCLGGLARAEDSDGSGDHRACRHSNSVIVNSAHCVASWILWFFLF